MPDFAWVGLDTAGREKSGHVRADTSEAARDQLTRRRLYVVRLEPAVEAAGGPAAARAGLFARRKLSAKQLTLFTRQLATLVTVSPLEEALRTISLQAEREEVRRVLGNVHAGLVEGLRLADAMAREAASFPPLYRAMVAAGEASGTLPQILERLAALLERQAQVRGKVLSTLAYPIILAIFAAFVVFALMIFVVPKVVEQFQDVLALGTFLWIQAMKDEGFRMKVDRLLLRLPLVGRLIRDLHAARMARTLSTMVASRLPLLEGLRLTTETVHNRVLRAASAEIAESVRTGGSLSGALRKAGIFPPLLVYLAASGEASGKLDVMLERAADYLEREFDTFTTTALALLEPAIIIFMGVIVALIVLSILLPILQLDTLAGGYR